MTEGTSVPDAVPSGVAFSLEGTPTVLPGPADVSSERLVHMAADAVIVGDVATGHVILWNGAAGRTFGLSSAEAVGMPIENLVPTRLKETVRAGLACFRDSPRDAPAGPGAPIIVQDCPTSNASLSVDLTLALVPPPAPPGLMVVTARSVRERHQVVVEPAQRAESLAEQSALLGLAPDAIFARGLEHAVTYWSQEAEGTYGWSPDEVIGSRPEDRLHTEYPIPIEDIERIVSETGTWVGNIVQETRDGRRLTVESRWEALGDADHLPTGFLEIDRDITSHMVEEAERERLATDADRARTHSLLFESNPQAMWFYDIKTQAFLDVNDAAIEQYGYSRDEFRSMTIANLRAEEDAPTGCDHTGATQPRGVRRHLTRSGKAIQVEITSHVNSSSGRDICFQVALDVTERERIQQQLQQARRLESMGELAGGVAHDFNNLLAVILNYASFVADEIVDSRAGADRLEEAEHDIDQIRIAAERAARLTHQLLAFARKDIQQPRVVNLNDIIADVEPMLRLTLGEHITLSLSLAPTLRPILADRGQLEQVLVNLAVNARDAMPDGGTLTIDTGNVDVDSDGAWPGVSGMPYAQLRVSDTGIGMPPEVVDRAFEPFFTTHGPGEGSGLGLATVYGIIAQAGGRAEIVSQPGAGTVFTAFLPSTDRVLIEEGEESSLAGASLGGDETILVVEDDGGLRGVVRRVLHGYGYKVIVASDGREGMELASSYPGTIHLMVADVVMPFKSGMDLATHFRKDRPMAGVLYMSGYAEPVLDEAAQGDSVSFIRKPFSSAGLAARVREILDRIAHVQSRTA